MTGQPMTHKIGTASSQRLKYRQWHRLNALFLFAFITLHMSTHLSGLFGIENYNAVQMLFRTVYRNPLIEPVLLTSITLQLLLGLRLIMYALRIDGWPREFWSIVQILSGVLLTLFLVQHITAMLITRYGAQLDTNFYWPASVMSGPPLTYYFVPYYFLAVSALMAHLGAGFRFLLMDREYKRIADLTGLTFLISGLLMATAILLSLSGILFPIELPTEWLDYLHG